MFPVGFVLAVPRSERPQTHTLDRAASETDAIQFSVEFLYTYEEYVNLWNVYLHIVIVYTYPKFICPYCKKNGHVDM